MNYKLIRSMYLRDRLAYNFNVELEMSTPQDITLIYIHIKGNSNHFDNFYISNGVIYRKKYDLIFNFTYRILI